MGSPPETIQHVAPPKFLPVLQQLVLLDERRGVEALAKRQTGMIVDEQTTEWAGQSNHKPQRPPLSMVTARNAFCVSVVRATCYRLKAFPEETNCFINRLTTWLTNRRVAMRLASTTWQVTAKLASDIQGSGQDRRVLRVVVG